jgi:hypothetical protein
MWQEAVSGVNETVDMKKSRHGQIGEKNERAGDKRGEQSTKSPPQGPEHAPEHRSHDRKPRNCSGSHLWTTWHHGEQAERAL